MKQKIESHYRSTKYLFLVCLAIVGFSLFPTKAQASIEQVQNKIELNINLDKNNSVEVIQKTTLTGDSNDKLSSGIIIYIPFEEVVVQKVKVNGSNHTYNAIENRVYVNLEQNLIKNLQKANIELTYTIPDIIKDSLGYKYLDFPSPENSKDPYEFSINDKSEAWIATNINTNDANALSGKALDDILLIWKKSNFNAVSYKLSSINNTVIPIISDRNEFVSDVTFIKNSKSGIVDEKENFYLEVENPEEQFEIEGEFIYTLNPNEKKINPDVANTIRKEVINMSSSTKFEFDSTFDVTKSDRSDLNSLEYCLLISEVLNKKNIENEIVYGYIQYPRLSPTLHFWIESGENSVIYDPFLFDLFSLETPVIDIPNIPFGKVDPKHLENITALDTINKINLDHVEYISVSNTTPVPYPIDISLYKDFNNNLFINYTNNQPYFGFIKKDSSSNFPKGLSRVLLIPNSIKEVDAKVKLDKDFDNSLKYNLGGKTFDIEINIKSANIKKEIFGNLGLFIKIALVFVISLFTAKYLLIDKKIHKEIKFFVNKTRRKTPRPLH